MAAGMETAFAVGLRSRWSGKLPCGEHRAAMTAVGRPPPACHPRAWPLHGGRDTRRASPFPDSSPPPGERIKERGDAPRKRSRRQRGGRTQRLEVAPAAPLTLPSPPKGRGRQERAARAGMMAVGRPAPACHPRARPLHRGRETRRASPFPDSSPPPGERIKERGDAPRKRSRRERGDVSKGSRWRQQPPSPFPLPPRGEGDKNEQRARK